MQIMPLTEDLIPSAQALVNAVFPQQCLSERLSFWTYPRRESAVVRLLYRLLGVKKLIGYWVATDAGGQVVAITGLYEYVADAADAVWLGWFCVAPEARHSGMGSRLLDFAIEKARETGKRCLRLYTSTDPNEAAAQMLYEKKGFLVTREERQRAATLIFREKRLAGG